MRWLLSLLAVVVLIFIGLSTYYYFYFLTCRITVSSGKDAPQVKIANRAAWNSFINILTSCRHGEYSIYDPGAKKFTSIKNIQFIIAVTPQKKRVSRGNETVFSWELQVKPNRNKAEVYLHVPSSDSETTAKNLHSAIFITAYYLFKGERYQRYDPKFAGLSSLEAIGLAYAKD